MIFQTATHGLKYDLLLRTFSLQPKKLQPIMDDTSWSTEFAWQELPSPCFVVDAARLAANARLLAEIRARSGCRILLALKGFSMFSSFDVLRPHLDGVCASSPHEARLGREEFNKEVQAFAAAYSEADIRELSGLCDTIIFNSFNQMERFRPYLDAVPRPIRRGLRVNPECSTAATALYDPCASGSRLGITRAEFHPDRLAGISGLHFHCLCEQDADALEVTLAAFEKKFGEFLDSLSWVNFGGGHHITRPGYDVERLVRLVTEFRDRHPGLTVYLEPGEAVALNTGVLMATVLDIVHNGLDIAILDTSAETHMPDVLAMPYRPRIVGAGEPGEYPHLYRLGGVSCLAGDVIGDYAFPRPLAPGDRLLFLDMAHYSMVKTTTFNGVQLPAIVLGDSRNGGLRVVRRFGYADFKSRL
jgi:carboxynorspermidine decarboxylase